jgi:hypothetical protein
VIITRTATHTRTHTHTHIILFTVCMYVYRENIYVYRESMYVYRKCMYLYRECIYVYRRILKTNSNFSPIHYHYQIVFLLGTHRIEWNWINICNEVQFISSKTKILRDGAISPKSGETWSGCRKSVEHLNVLSALTIWIWNCTRSATSLIVWLHT